MRRISILAVFVLVTVSVMAVETYDGLYDTIYPETYSTLSVNGNLGSYGTSSQNENVLELQINNGFSFNMNGFGSYLYVDQREDTLLVVDVDGNLQLGSIRNGFSAFSGAPVSYTSHTLELGGYDGFYTAGGSFSVSLYDSGSWYTISPFAGVGVGRTYTITTLYRILTMCKYLDVEPTPERISEVREVMERSGSHFAQFREDDSELDKEYVTDLAAAFGIPDRLLDVAYIGNSQVYAFERARYDGLTYGWDASVLLQPQVRKTTFGTPTFGTEVHLAGEYNTFLLEDMLYVHADVDIYTGYRSGLLYGAAINGRAVYFPDDYHWWAESSLVVSGAKSVGLDADLQAEANYLIDPNFNVYGGAEIGTSRGLGIYAGGSIRIW